MFELSFEIQFLLFGKIIQFSFPVGEEVDDGFFIPDRSRNAVYVDFVLIFCVEISSYGLVYVFFRYEDPVFSDNRIGSAMKNDKKFPF